MADQLHRADYSRIGYVQGRYPSIPVAHVDQAAGCIVSYVIRIRAKLHSSSQLKGRRIICIDYAVSPVGNENPEHRWQEEDPLGFPQPSDALDKLTTFQVYYSQCIIPKHCNVHHAGGWINI